MPNNKKKSLKKIKNIANAHPYSRKAHQLQRATNRADKISAQHKQAERSKYHLVTQKYLWFREQAKRLVQTNIEQHQPQQEKEIDEIQLDISNSTSTSLPKFIQRENLISLTKKYLSRNDKLIASILANKRPNRPLSAKDELFISSVNTEKREASSSGIRVPDLSSKSTLDALFAWNGDHNAIDHIKSITLKIQS
ncbi:hypothetical protein BB560_000103 [Smittium megazygosporum]|uniref:Translation machinery-associated protein 16 n=1 Tax=Smittium megazygosporum TaxID=133381 RepID=A0A2T9ZLE8_9FUNG|nr:hypothetical protein BB560_000106 [Smittium megazygosporum]PVV05383.1 hypothetical protein BB560_000103 [Smittium megazygosporum]